MADFNRMKSPHGAGRAPGAPIPNEGEGGVFSQTWFPICLSSEVLAGTVVGRDFLNGQVIVARGREGRCSVMSAYCAHVGANLKVGRLIGDEVECAFHRWRYDLTGKCVATGSGDPPPPAACLFKFPTVEKLGLIWAFNGERPTFELPAFEHADEELVHKALCVQSIDLDPWVVMCNTLDLQHLKVVHGMQFKIDGPVKSAVWTDHSVLYDIEMARRDSGVTQRVKLGVFGTNIFYRSGLLNGRYIGSLTPCALVGPGRIEIYLVQATTRGDGSDRDLRAAREFLDESIALSSAIITEDQPIMEHIKFAAGYLTRSDQLLANFLEYLRRYPRTHPSASYIT